MSITNISRETFRVHANGEEVRWRLTVAPEAIDSWELLLCDVAQACAEQLPKRDLAAWQHACEAGRGPDADADIAGWRHVATAIDYEAVDAES